MEVSEMEGYPYVAIGLYETACEGKPTWVAGNEWYQLSDGRTFLRKGRLGKHGRWLKKGYEEFFVARNTLYELNFDGTKYEEVPEYMKAGEYRAKI